MGGIKTNLDNIHLLALENYKNKVDKSKKGRGRHRDCWLTYSIKEFLLLHQKGATNRELSEIYGISIRYVQYIMKEVGLASNDFRNKSNIKITSNNRRNKSNIKANRNSYELKYRPKDKIYYPKNEGIMNEIKNKDEAWVYALISDDKVLYVGKCEKTVRDRSNSKSKNPCYIPYTLIDRLRVHFITNSRSMPKEVYEVVDTIRYVPCKKDDVLKIENNAILYFKRNGQCIFNNMCNFTDWNNVGDVDLSGWRIYNKK